MKNLIVITAIAYLAHQYVGDHFKLVKYNSDDEVIVQIGTYSTLEECRVEEAQQKEKAELLEFLSSSFKCEQIEWFTKK